MTAVAQTKMGQRTVQDSQTYRMMNIPNTLESLGYLYFIMVAIVGIRRGDQRGWQRAKGRDNNNITFPKQNRLIRLDTPVQ